MALSFLGISVSGWYRHVQLIQLDDRHTPSVLLLDIHFLSSHAAGPFIHPTSMTLKCNNSRVSKHQCAVT